MRSVRQVAKAHTPTEHDSGGQFAAGVHMCSCADLQMWKEEKDEQPVNRFCHRPLWHNHALLSTRHNAEQCAKHVLEGQIQVLVHMLVL